MKKTDPVDLTGKKPAVMTMVTGESSSSESSAPGGIANSKVPLPVTMTVESTVMSLKKGQKIRVVSSAGGIVEQTDEGEFYGADSTKKELTYYRKAGMYKTLSFDDLVRVEVIAEYSESGPLDY